MSVNEGREKQATETLDSPGAKWAWRLAWLAALSGQESIAGSPGVGVEGPTQSVVVL